MIRRYLDISQSLEAGKTLVLLGPRRTGKTTLLQQYIAQTSEVVVSYRGDELSTQRAFSSADSVLLAPHIGSAAVLAIDEAQAIPGIGQSLKIINDTMPDLSVIVTGSAAFELAGQVGEPLTGRQNTYQLFPVAIQELLRDEVTPAPRLQQLLPQLLVYGMYPNAVTVASLQDRERFLRELVNAYLLKDILAYQEVKSPQLLLQLLRLLAYQIGGEVSLGELSGALDIDGKTVARYLDLLEKSYIIFRLGGYSRNLRSEVTRTAKYYFYDVGVRNAVINNYNELPLRNDIGQLWENFAIVERLKSRSYNQVYANQYFWRTWQQSEVDLVEERGGKLYGYEMKWSHKKALRTKPPKEWLETYPNEAQWEQVTPETLLGFLASSHDGR